MPLQQPEIVMGLGVPRLNLSWQAPREQWDDFLGQKLGEDSYDVLLTEDADVFTPEGELLLNFRKKCIPQLACADAFAELRKLNQKTSNRGMASGKGLQRKRIRQDGTISNTNEVPREHQVISNIIGYFDRYTRIPYCRQTAYNANHPEEFARVLPFLKGASAAFARHAPERFAVQMEVVKKTNPDFVIQGTVFTTITVNKNWQTAVHTDKGDLKEGLSCITALRAGKFTGGNLVFPHYRVAVNLDTSDLLLFDSHHMHGNTPLVAENRREPFERVSLVLYYRKKMQHCLSSEGELQRAKNRRHGQPLWEEEHLNDGDEGLHD